MKTIFKLTTTLLSLWTMCYVQVARAEPQDNFWIESVWPTNLPPSYFHSVAFNTNGQVIVGNWNESIMLFETNGALVRSWAADVHDLDVSTNGLIFAVVAGNLIRVYDSFGNTVRQWSLGFQSMGIGVSSSGLVFVSDYANYRIRVYDSQGNFIRQWGAQGTGTLQFGYPMDVAVGASGQVYVSDQNNSQIKVFSPEGTFIKTLSGYDTVRVAVSPDENLVLSSTASDMNPIGTFSADGQQRVGFLGKTIVVSRRSYSTTGAKPLKAIPLPIISKVEQRPGTTWADIDFKVVDPDSPNVRVAAVAFLNGQTNLASIIPMRTFEEGTGTSVGTNIASGVSHRLTWNAAADWSTTFANLQVEILAQDNRGLLDFHFLTIPVPINLPPLTISQFPVNDVDFLNTWTWLIASGNTNLILTNGNVMGLSGNYSSKMLTSNNGTVTTADGRLFLFAQLNVRVATPAEITRAKGSGVKWVPRVQLQGRPLSVNEFGFDTGSTNTSTNYWVVPVP